MPALPFTHPDHVPAALGLAARGNRASLAFSSSGLAHQFLFQSPYQLAGRQSDMAHRHFKSLSLGTTPDSSTAIGRLFDDGQIFFAEATKTHD